MKFELIKKIEKVKHYVAFSKNLALLLKDESFMYDNKVLGHSFEGFFFYDNYLHYSEDGVNTITLDTKTYKKEHIPKIFSSNSVQNNTFLVGNNYERFNDTSYYSAEIELYQLNPYKLLKILPKRYVFSQFIRHYNFLFTEKFRTILSSLSLYTGEYAWETTINRNGKILNFLGVHKDVLVVCLQFGNAYGLMGLDINTGEILWNRDDWGLLQGHHSTMQNGKIFSLKGGTFSDSYYLEADVVTVSLLRFGEVPNLKNHGFSVFNYTLHENFIYFTANKLGTSEATIIGILAYDSLELLWWQELDLQNGVFLAQKPQVDDNKLYILDTGGTLHIFEREEVA